MTKLAAIFPDMPEPLANARGPLAGHVMMQNGDPVNDMAQSLRNIEALLFHMVSGVKLYPSDDTEEIEVEDAKSTKPGARSQK